MRDNLNLYILTDIFFKQAAIEFPKDKAWIPEELSQHKLFQEYPLLPPRLSPLQSGCHQEEGPERDVRQYIREEKSHHPGIPFPDLR